MRSAVLAVLYVWTITAGAAVHTPGFILHSYSQEYPWTKRQHEGFIGTLESLPGHAISSSVEYLDTKRIAYSPAYAERMATHFEEKYRDYRPKFVYVTDDNALSFALTHLMRIFPDTPVFFSGINNHQIRELIDPARVTGVFERKEIAPNLALMRHIAPGSQDILVVGDASETYQAIREEIQAELRTQPGISARFISQGLVEDLVRELRGHRERFVFLTTLGQIDDARGETLTLRETLKAIVEAGDFTILSMEDVYLEPGVLGGYVTSGTRQGETAARLVVRHLEGTPVERIAPEASPNEYQFDAAELHETGLILPDAIARNARILHPLPSFIEQHQTLILGVLYGAAVLFALALVGFLLTVMRKNRQILRSSSALSAQTEHLNQIRESLLRAQRIAGMGNWDWWIAENRLYWSEGIYRLFGIDPQDFEASYEGFLARVHPDDRHRVDTAVRHALQNHAPYDITHRIVRPNGEIRIVHENAEIIRDDAGKAVRMTGALLDMTAQQQIEAALRDSEARLRTVIQGFPIILWMIDRNGVFLLSEGKGLETQGLKPGEVVGQSLFERYRDHPEVIRDARSALEGQSFTSTCWMGEHAFEVHYSPLLDASGAANGAIGVATDITERKRTEERLSFLASYDPVTGLPNRSLFNDRLDHAMKHADRSGNKVGLLFIDLDNFKTINDTLGHSAGDELLRQVALRFSAAIRVDDTVSRLGGDEFTLILEDLGSAEDAARVASEILQHSAIPYELEGSRLYVTASIGIALYPQDGADVQSLVMNADAAMYRAKDNGRNNFQFFDKAISAGAQERLEIGNLLRGALARGEFSLHYQPQIETGNGRVIGFEALLRWASAERGSIPPNVFIPLLEDTGLIIPVGEWVLQEACRWAAILAGTGSDAAPSIAVNLSARQFHQPDLPGVVAAALDASGLCPDRLELEITESSLVNIEKHLETMDRLKQIGVRLSIDDFGTGYSSLSYLKRFPIDRLKIDASFVRDVATDPDDAAIVTTIIGLGHNLNLKIIAEGVETTEQLHILRGQGCDEIQGYLVARPMPAQEVAAWLQNWRGRVHRWPGTDQYLAGSR
jgi:diguanylate cyclase (GGDEF)-like protein/PAS domain S-box-containing protein